MMTDLLTLLQVPTHIPGPENDPLVFSIPNIIIFILIPVALFVFYIWWERSRAKKRKEQEEDKST